MDIMCYEQLREDDCFRTCLASLVGLTPDKVPHFFHDNFPMEVAWENCQRWCGNRGFDVECYEGTMFDGFAILQGISKLDGQTPHACSIWINSNRKWKSIFNF